VDWCDECGYVYDAVATSDVPEQIKRVVADLVAAFAGIDPALVRMRSNSTTWSALEYACHIRDVFLIQRDRAVLAQVEDRPSFARMYCEERVWLCGYDEHVVADVLTHVEVAAELCATAFARIPTNAWTRRFIYNWPSASDHDLLWLARHTRHEGVHHVMDVRRCLAVAANRGAP
jgi:hypothetical protein